MFEKEAEEYVMREDVITENNRVPFDNGYGFQTVSFEDEVKKGFQDGAEFGYKLAHEEMDYLNKHWGNGKDKANEWHYVKDKLPEMDELVYFWNKNDNFPVVARRHIPYGHKEWVWDCKWGSGYTVSQSVGKDYLWKEIVLPEFPKESE